jgi:Brp/Blh family beta-carotene 15,15'-monooxygenase
MDKAATERVFRTLPLSLMAAAAAGGAVWGVGWTELGDAMPWLVSLGFVGLPHGAADLAVSWKTQGRADTLRLAGVYVAFMAGVLALFLLLPLAVVAAFAALSVWHFGMAHVDGQEPPFAGGALAQAAAAVARGGLVLGVPMARWPASTASVAEEVVRLAAGGPVAVDTALVRTLGLVLSGAAIAAFAGEALWSWRQPDAWHRTRQTAVELVVIAALGFLAPPLFAVGVYFLCWHGWRQMRLLMPIITGAAPTNAASLARGLAAVHLAGLPLLLPTWLVLAVAWWLLSPGHSARELALLSLVAYLVVTPSHDLLVDLVRQRSASRAERLPPSSIPPSCAARSASCSA